MPNDAIYRRANAMLHFPENKAKSLISVTEMLFYDMIDDKESKQTSINSNE